MGSVCLCPNKNILKKCEDELIQYSGLSLEAVNRFDVGISNNL